MKFSMACIGCPEFARQLNDFPEMKSVTAFSIFESFEDFAALSVRALPDIVILGHGAGMLKKPARAFVSEHPEIIWAGLTGENTVREDTKASVELGISQILFLPTDDASVSEFIRSCLKKAGEAKHAGTSDFLGKKLSVYQNSFILERVAGSREVSEETARERARRLKLRLPGPKYCVVIFYPDLSDCGAAETDMLLSRAEQLIDRKLSEHFECYTLPDSFNNIVALASLHEDEEQLFNAAVTEATELILHDMKISTFAGIGSIADRFSAVDRSFAAAGDALSYKYVFSAGQIISAKDLGHYYRWNTREYKHHYDRVLGCFYDGNLELMRTRLDELIEYIRSSGLNETDSMRNVCIELTSAVLRRVKELGMGIEDESEQYQNIEELTSSHEAEEWFIELCRGLLEKSSASHSNRNRQIISFADEYISQNLSDPLLSVQTISDHVDLSPSYFSSIFFKETGLHVNEYINIQRVNAAKEKLLSSNMKVAFISADLGFSSPNYFNKVFRKYTDMTPGMFRSCGGNTGLPQG